MDDLRLFRVTSTSGKKEQSEYVFRKSPTKKLDFSPRRLEL
jgi:hypothetical protein